jgi:hypothetical protein
MRTPASRPKKSSVIKPQHKVGMARRAVRARKAGAIPAAAVPPGTSQRNVPTKIALRKEFRGWKESLPTALERDTLLVPEWIAESVVQEAERFLQADLPEDFAARLAAKAHRLYPRHAQFKKLLNRPGNAGRNHLYLFMRHWTSAWLKRERFALYKKLPWSYGQGQPLPAVVSGGPKNNRNPDELVTKNLSRPTSA